MPRLPRAAFFQRPPFERLMFTKFLLSHLSAVAERFGSVLPTGDLDRLTRDLLKIAAKNEEPGA